MNLKETSNALSEVINKDYVCDVIELFGGAIANDPKSILLLSEKIFDAPIQFKNAIYWNKFIKFVDGVSNYNTTLDEGVSLMSEMFDGKKRQDNILRVIEYIDKVDTDKKVDFLINITKSRLVDIISIDEYFRLMKCIVDTLYEDLIFLKQNIDRVDVIKGNFSVLSLAKSGLMIQGGIDANENVESQDYRFTTLGYMLDQYGLSYGNEERQCWHNKRDNHSFNLENNSLKWIEH